MGHLVSNTNFHKKGQVSCLSISVDKQGDYKTNKVVLNLQKRDKTELSREKNPAYSYLAL